MRNGVLVALMGLMVAAPAAGQFVAPGGVIPVVANNSGENGTFWTSNVSILNVGESDEYVVMLLYPEIVGGEAEFDMLISDEVKIPAGTQKTFTNILWTVFEKREAKGGLLITPTSVVGQPLVLSSRVFTYGNSQCDGSYGQDVNGQVVVDTAWAAGLAHDSFFRTNLGIFLPTDPPPGSTIQYTVEVYDKDGALVGSGVVSFKEAGLQQKSLSSFNVDRLVDGYAVITCSESEIAWYAYASRVDEISGDAVFRPARSYQPE